MERVQFAASATLVGNRLSGIAHTYGRMAKIDGKFYETFSVGAFNRVLKDPNTDVRSFFNHSPNMMLGRQKAGTLRVQAEDDGLHFEIDLPNTTYADDLKTLVERGDIDGCSFGIIPLQSAITFSKHQDGLSIRTHHDVRELVDVAPVTLPAFAGTSLELRASSYELEESVGSQLIRARIRAGRR